MYEQIQKSKTNKNRTVSNSVSHKKSNVNQTFWFVDNRPESVAQRKIMETNNSPKGNKLRVTQRLISNSNVLQLNGEWTAFQKAVAEGTISIEISPKHIKGNPKKKRMVRSGGRRRATGPVSNQSQERVLQNAIEAVIDGTARFIASTDTDFTIEVDSEHGLHGARRFNIHKGGGGETTRYIHQILGDSSRNETPDDAEYSDTDSEVEDDYFDDEDETPLAIAAK